MMHALAHDEDGYTLAETTVALVVVTLVVAGGYSAFVFAQQLTTAWKRSARLENAVHRILRDVTRRAHAAVQIEPGSAPRLRVRSASGRAIRYDVRGTRLRRNDQPMHGDDIRTLAFTVRPVSDAARPDRARSTPDAPQCVDWTSDAPSPSHEAEIPPRRLRIHVSLASGRDTLQVCTSVEPRAAATWTAMSDRPVD